VLLAFGTGDRGLLDDEASVGDDDHESRVVEVIRPTSMKTCDDRLEQLSTQPYDVCSRTQRDPVEIDRCGWRAFFLRRLAFLGVHAEQRTYRTAALSARSLIPRSIRSLITKASTAVGSTMSGAHGTR